MRQDKTAEAMKPGLRRLFQTIKGLYDIIDMCGKLMMNKTRRLFHVHILGQITM